jgi:hypothetical protein
MVHAMHPELRAFVLPVALFAVVACGTPAPAQAPAQSGDAARAPLPASDAKAAPSTQEKPMSGPPTAPACRMTASETQGCGASDVEALVAPARPRLEACHHGSGGKLRIRVRESGGKLAFDAQPGSSLDPRERQCLLEALSSLNDTTSTNLSFGPSVPPTGFSSLLTIEW